MEVNKISFYPLLLDILTDISEAHFVAFDLELSGVPSKQAKNFDGAGRPTLQQRYLETKEAAERYQILQIGLTCVQQDVKNGKYILKPYNFELSPLIEESRLDIERIFSYQSSAAEFLLKVGFDMSLPFTEGIPYLSRAESKVAREKHAKRQDKSSISDIQIKPTETESLAFLGRVRSEINAWLPKSDTIDYVNIGAIAAAEAVDKDKENAEPLQDLSRFEKRLVHQLVRAEYPELVTISKRGWIQIVRFNQEREDQIAADRKRDLHERIGRQKGFRWIIEALHGSAIANLDLRQCARDPLTGEHVYADMDEYKSQFHRASALLRENPRVLVGHNCFLDLVYIYRHFIGILPDTVEEFQRKINHLWPMIIDTKYMSTHNCGDINPISSLEQIAHQLSSKIVPVLEVDVEHKKYENVEILHEAGYDSFLTAQIAVKLSAKLETDGAYIDADAVINGNGDLQGEGETTNGHNEKEQEITNGIDVSGEEVTNGIQGLKLTSDNIEKHTYHVESGTSPPSEVNGFMPSVEGGRWKRRGDPTLPPQDPDDPFEYDPKHLKHRHQNVEGEQTFKGGMPRFGSDFWRVYGNKLRVFGTQEAVCMLDGGHDDADGDDGEVGQGGVEL